MRHHRSFGKDINQDMSRISGLGMAPPVAALRTLLVALVTIVGFGDATAYAQDDEPPLDPGAEIPADNASFVEKCLEGSSRLKLEVGHVLLTQTDKWGLVVRADFTTPGFDSGPYINRLVCWQRPSGRFSVVLAPGQTLKPLPGSR